METHDAEDFGLFRPNTVEATDAALAALEPWQQLVMALHFAPHMVDCVKQDYRYAIDSNGEEVECYSADGKYLQTLGEDCDADEPWNTLCLYYDWRNVACTFALIGMQTKLG